MRFVKIDNLYINLDRVTTMYVTPAYCSIDFVPPAPNGDDPVAEGGTIVLQGERAERLREALDAMIGDGVYAA